MLSYMKNDQSHLLTFSFLGIQLTFWPIVLPVIVVSTLLDVLALDGPGCCELSTDVLDYFCSSFIRFGKLTFPLCYGTQYLCKVCELFLRSFCYLIQSGILSLIHFFYFLKTLSYKAGNKIKVTDKFPFIKSGRSKIIPLCIRVRPLSLFTTNVSV